MTESAKTDPPPVAPGRVSRWLNSKPAPGTRGWWWSMRAINANLFVLPLIPALNGVMNFLKPTEWREPQGGITSPGATVTKVVVELDAPSVAERFTAALPSLILLVVLALASWALWRIEVNMSHGGGQRPFTEKDAKAVRLAFMAVVGGWLAVFLLGLLSPQLSGVSSDTTFLMLVAVCLLASMSKIYAKGMRAYEDLEKIV